MYLRHLRMPKGRPQHDGSWACLREGTYPRNEEKAASTSARPATTNQSFSDEATHHGGSLVTVAGTAPSRIKVDIMRRQVLASSLLSSPDTWKDAFVWGLPHHLVCVCSGLATWIFSLAISSISCAQHFPL